MSGASAPLEQYKRVNVETASQGKLIVMLFNGAIQRAEEARRHIGNNEVAQAHKCLIRAQDILTELRGALDFRAGGEVATNLDRIYEYFYHLLVRANVRKETEPVEECIRLMTTMRDIWEELFQDIDRQPAPLPSPGPNPPGPASVDLRG